MIDWVAELENYKTRIYRAESEAKHYHFVDNKSDTLVIVAGDSWTWGDSLDPGKRLDQVYGCLIANHFEADWINIGCKGWSNSWILLHPTYIIDRLKDSLQYKKIYVILTLTENGRDIGTPVSHPYDYIQCYRTHGLTEEFYNSVLHACEQRWVDQINQMIDSADDRYCFFLGQNFAWHQYLVNCLRNRITVADSNWIEQLADHQKLVHPIRTNLVTGWIFDTLKQINSIAYIKDHSVYQQWTLDLIDRANQVNTWLDSSDLNCKKASKHPTDIGHQLWANYVIGNIENYE